MMIVQEYDVKVDKRNRITLKNPQYSFFHVCEYADGRIILEPKKETAFFSPEPHKARNSVEIEMNPTEFTGKSKE